ncbi:MAG: threonine aldolase [Actinobacteria bacterium]|nr:threonine aldolase [Actinomycetota bacterium]NBY15180.1 threonine aldolase [Actinomycetota bacterium]
MSERNIWRGFASDNYAGVHPKILSAVNAVNDGHEIAYGEDTVTARFTELVKEHFGVDAAGFPVFNGTGANVIALQAALEQWEAVLCTDSAHIHVDEGGAPEKMAGIKLWTVPTETGKLTPELIEAQLFDVGVVHRAQIGAVSIAQSTELGTIYSVAEIRAIAETCHKNNLLLHMDGARLSNAAAALGLSFKEFTTDLGVDLVSLGGTKIGALAAEAVIVTNAKASDGSKLANAVPFLRKTSMQLASKMRFASAQLNALLENGAELALENARHANALAKVLEAGLLEIAKEFPVVSLPNSAEANAVFPVLPSAVIEKLQQKYRFYVWDQALGQVRWMCAWDNQIEDVEGLLAELRSALQANS